MESFILEDCKRKQRLWYPEEPQILQPHGLSATDTIFIMREQVL